jgi:ADP-ribose pyrophosphatase YjhB (NUDIX family)
MKNFPVKVTEDTIIDGENMKGRTIWASPSVAVAMFVFHTEDDKTYVLANKRGKGCPDYVGYWSCPCGYLEYGDRSIEDAASRELFEESGIDFSNCLFNLFGIHKDDNGKENITFRFWATTDYHLFDNKFYELTDKYSEPDEIEEQKWIPISEVGNYKWAFGHEKLIFEGYIAYSTNLMKHNDILC